MPELPEVETVRRGLERTIVGKTIKSVDVRAPKLFAEAEERISEALVGATVLAAERRAKVLIVRLSSTWTLAIHLKMTGQLVVKRPEFPNTKSQFSDNDQFSSPKGLQTTSYKLQTTQSQVDGFAGGHPEKAYEQPLPHKHTHIIIHFTDGTTLYFNDLRKFGWFRLYPGLKTNALLAIEDVFKASKLGPEPFSDDFSLSYFAQTIKKRRIPIKTVLLDQAVVAGVGNIYADEALFRAKIKPTRSASSLSKQEIVLLHPAITEVLQLGIDYGGTTMNTFRNVEGTAGKMREYLKVYGREGEPCTICGNPIERIKIGQRSSHFCTFCQR